MLSTGLLLQMRERFIFMILNRHIKVLKKFKNQQSAEKMTDDFFFWDFGVFRLQDKNKNFSP